MTILGYALIITFIPQIYRNRIKKHTTNQREQTNEKNTINFTKINKTYEQHLLSLHSRKLLTIKPLKSLFNSSYNELQKIIIYDTSSPHKLKINVPE